MISSSLYSFSNRPPVESLGLHDGDLSFHVRTRQSEQVNEETLVPSLGASRDVMICAPQDDGIFKSASDRSLEDTLRALGVGCDDELNDVAATARLSELEISELVERGYQVYDNSPRIMWQGSTLHGLAPTPEKLSPTRIPAKPSGQDVTEWMNLDGLRQAGLTGRGQIVAVLDSGFHYPGFTLKGWKDMVESSSSPIDQVGHGTHVVSDVLKVAPEADIVAVKVMAGDGRGRPSDIVRGLQWVTQQKLQGLLDVDVINLSLGDTPDGYPDVDHPVNRAVEAATLAGITVVAAAGNSGPGRRSLGTPADSPYAITVGGTGDGRTVSEFSSRGPTEDGLSKPDVVAPAEGLAGWSVPGSAMERTALAAARLRDLAPQDLKNALVAHADLRRDLQVTDKEMDMPPDEMAEHLKTTLSSTRMTPEGLLVAPGTSFAAPLVSGVLACLEQARDISPQESQQLLRTTATALPDATAADQGAGLVNAGLAYLQLVSA